MEGFAAEAPAFLRVDDAGQGVGDDVEVGGDFQTVKGYVVAGVDDGGEAAGSATS